MNNGQGASPYQQGYEAFGQVPWGESEIDFCPYYSRSEEGMLWLAGYYEAACNWYDQMWCE